MECIYLYMDGVGGHALWYLPLLNYQKKESNKLPRSRAVPSRTRRGITEWLTNVCE